MIEANWKTVYWMGGALVVAGGLLGDEVVGMIGLAIVVLTVVGVLEYRSRKQSA